MSGAVRLEKMRCELCARDWYYLVASRDDLPDFCKECKAAYLATQRQAPASEENDQ